MSSSPTPLVVALALALVVSAAGAVIQVGAEAAGADTAEPEVEIAPGYGGKVVKGREDNEDQMFPGNTTFRIDATDHRPGADNTSFNVYATGLTENVNMHYTVLEQRSFRWDGCVAGVDSRAFGIDRGNDDAGTTTDESLLESYENAQYYPDGVFVKFYKEEQLGDLGPVHIRVNDQIVARVVDCLQNPDEEGWYRAKGYINGSTKNDTTTDYTIYGASSYVYICENCDSREEAKEALGPVPTTCPSSDRFQQDDKEWVCRTEDGTYYTHGEDPGSGASPTPTATPTPGGTATATPTPSPTPTPTATPTPTQSASPTPSAKEGPTTPRGTDTGTTTGPTDTAETPTETQVAGTPTLGTAPGFGTVASLVALVAAALVALRRN